MPGTGHAEGLLSPQLNTKIVNAFLAQFGQTIPADEHAVMLWDGAGFHASKQLCVGNMSSATVLFILESLMAQKASAPCVMLGFGPGLVAEAALLL